jgi:hypothetical protein
MPSTLIRAFSYDAASRTLAITFVSGALYRYLDVPEEAAAGMRGAFAKGEYFNRHIRCRYRFERVAAGAENPPSSMLRESDEHRS